MKREHGRAVFIGIIQALKEHYAGILCAYRHYVLILIICVDRASLASVKAQAYFPWKIAITIIPTAQGEEPRQRG